MIPDMSLMPRTSHFSPHAQTSHSAPTHTCPPSLAPLRLYHENVEEEARHPPWPVMISMINCNVAIKDSGDNAQGQGKSSHAPNPFLPR